MADLNWYDINLFNNKSDVFVLIRQQRIEMEELEKNAKELLKNREFEKAAKAYLQLAMTYPQEDKFLNMAANCYDYLKDKKVALSLYKKALAVNPNSLTAMLNISTIYYEQGKYEKSLEFANQVLAEQKDNFPAIMNQGNSFYALGGYEEALLCYEKMYKLNPNSYNAILNIANTSYNLGLYKQAAEYAEKAIEKRPGSPEAYIVLGNSYVELNQTNEAVATLKRAIEISPASDWLCNSLANLFQKIGNWKQALYYAWKAFLIKKQKATIDDHINFASMLYEAQDDEPDEQRLMMVDSYLKRWEEMFADNPVVRHATSALRHVQDVPSMDLTYVKSLFDGFAYSFDEILNSLNYQVPTLIAQVLKDHLKVKLFKKRRILDLGCGTGLCAEALKKYFPNEEFFGVDVSEKMLEMAGKKDIYKELYVDDINSFLEANETLYHAVVAGDVFTYMGDLKTLFRLLSSAVKFNGYLAFSIT
ncbi:MAG: tetratricopeptide repeat protein, partial [Alphaproteobacteria bacterium]|nr:tetratricopeptide repeat protein [Alphaproteobacteria bacterium]